MAIVSALDLNRAMSSSVRAGTIQERLGLTKSCTASQPTDPARSKALCIPPAIDS
jgi:hypothetical protein